MVDPLHSPSRVANPYTRPNRPDKKHAKTPCSYFVLLGLLGLLVLLVPLGSLGPLGPTSTWLTWSYSCFLLLASCFLLRPPLGPVGPLGPLGHLGWSAGWVTWITGLLGSTRPTWPYWATWLTWPPWGLLDPPLPVAHWPLGAWFWSVGSTWPPVLLVVAHCPPLPLGSGGLLVLLGLLAPFAY